MREYLDRMRIDSVGQSRSGAHNDEYCAHENGHENHLDACFARAA